MALQHRLKRRIKPLLFSNERVVRRIRYGPARGVHVWLNRIDELQVEFGLFETELNGIYRRYIEPGDLVFDIGAGDGFTSLMYANLGARVVAWEPNPQALRDFHANLTLNPVLSARISVLGDAYKPEPTFGTTPSLIKVDVDGAEEDVVAAIPLAPVVIIETHGPELETHCRVLLHNRGYETMIVTNAWWRRLYPEYRPIGFNRWLLATRDAA
jgi:Met-10+ like-protein